MIAMMDPCGTSICVVSPTRNAYSETFIRAHIEHLPATVLPLYGGSIAQLRDEHGDPLVPPFTIWRHARWSIARRTTHASWDDFQAAPFRECLRANQVSAVLAEYGTMGVAVMDVCAELGVPLIVHFHGFDAYRRDVLSGVGQRYPELFGSAAAIIAVSRDMEQHLIDLGAPPDKVHYNPYGVDVSRFGGAAPAEAPPTFVAVGRFVDKKAPFFTLLAFSKVLDSVPEARLVMIGEGPLWEASRQLARALGISSAVDSRGICPHAEVAASMQQARAFVQHSVVTSYGDSEGTPVAVLEASAAGLPVVATRHAGIPDVVLDGETGLLVDEGDVEGMAAQMIRLARDPELAARLGNAGRERVCAEFSMEKSIAGLWSIIEGAIHNAAR